MIPSTGPKNRRTRVKKSLAVDRDIEVKGIGRVRETYSVGEFGQPRVYERCRKEITYSNQHTERRFIAEERGKIVQILERKAAIQCKTKEDRGESLPVLPVVVSLISSFLPSAPAAYGRNSAVILVLQAIGH